MTDVNIATFPVKFRLEFDTVNDAFFSVGYMAEVARIIKDDIVPSLPTTLEVRSGSKLAGPIKDHNGNVVGRWVFEK